METADPPRRGINMRTISAVIFLLAASVAIGTFLYVLATPEAWELWWPGFNGPFHLYITELDQWPIMATSACIAAAAPFLSPAVHLLSSLAQALLTALSYVPNKRFALKAIEIADKLYMSQLHVKK